MLFINRLPVSVLLDLLWGSEGWVVLLLSTVVVIVHGLSVLLGSVLGALLVDEVHTLGLSELVNLSTGNTGEELLSEGVGDWLACRRYLSVCLIGMRGDGVSRHTVLALLILKELEGLEGSGTSNELVGELSLTVWLVILVDLLVGVVGLA